MMRPRSIASFSIAAPSPAAVRLVPANLPSSDPQFSEADRPSLPPEETTANLAEEYRKLKRSGAPSRVLSFRDGSWIDFPPVVVATLRDGFLAGRTFLEVYFAGFLYLFDFLRMTQVNSVTGASNSFGWIDVDGLCFFPANRPYPRSEIQLRIDGNCLPAESSTEGDSNNKPFDQADDGREQSGESPAVSSTGRASLPGAESLCRSDNYYRVVEKIFLSGVRRFAPTTIVTSIRKCTHTGPAGGGWRRRAFEMQIQMTKAARDGVANVKFGWYGTSASELPAIVAHGFGRPNHQLLGPKAYGVGVHISSPLCSYSSSLLSEPDGNGEKHIMLCRLITGRPEKVEEGSEQYHPSSDEFDSGVDDPANPKWYIVWSTHMNTHIIPEFIVSFKTTSDSKPKPHIAQGSRKYSKRPCGPSLSFSKLLAEVGGSLPSSTVRSLSTIYNQYAAGKISKESFIRYLRQLVGDKLLVAAVKKMRGF